MNLQKILFSWAILLSCFLNKAMEETSPKVYRFARQNNHWIQTTNIKKQRALSLDQIAKLTEEKFGKLPADQFESLPEENFIIIEQSFKQKFGYNVPTHPDDYKKTTVEAFFTNIFVPLNNSSTTAKSSTKLPTAQQQLEEKIENERFKRMMIEKNKKAQKEQEKRRREQEKTRNEQRILAAHKKEHTLQIAQKRMMPKQSPQQHHQQKNPLTQKRAIKSNLIKQYNCQTEKQLKDLLFQECSDEFPCMG